MWFASDIIRYGIYFCAAVFDYATSLNVEVQRYDGWYNNLAHPNWGSVGSRLYRKFVSNYSDGVYLMHADLPSARDVSDLVFQGSDGFPNRRNITTMLAFFSQMVAYEILQSSEPSCPLEMYKIPVKQCDRIYDDECSGRTMIPFFRAKYDKETGAGLNAPREQINEKTSWIDASFVYSTQVPWVDAIRSFENGTLREGPMPGYPPLNTDRLPLINPSPPHVHRLMDPERLFLLGDPRGNENPALLSFGLMFYRWHNVQARRLKLENPSWSDFDLFDRARQWVVATLQNIVLYEFLPALLNTTVDPYDSYNPEQPPGISHVFGAAAFRYPHTLIPPGMFLRNGECKYRKNVGGYSAIRLCNTWWNAQEVIQQYTVDEIILGMASQLAEGDDHVLVNDLRDFVFGPMHFTRRDLGALTIMRGRDHGLPDYNSVRRAMNLPERDWHQINPHQYSKNKALYDQLRQMYHDDIKSLDVYVGGMLEGNGESPGELFNAIIKEQFLRLRNADRFWFENRNNDLFSDEEIGAIRSTRLHDIIVATTEIVPSFLQRDVFFYRPGDPCPQPYHLNSSILEPCIKLMRYDYFQGNEVTFIFSCILLAIMPVLCAAVGYLMIKHRQRYFALKDKSSIGRCSNSFTAQVIAAALNNSDISETAPNISALTVADLARNEAFVSKRWQMPVTEWLHERYSRNVLLCIYGDLLLLSIEKRRGGMIRTVSLDVSTTLTINCSDDNLKGGQLYCQIVLPFDYDVVIKFGSRADCAKFLAFVEYVLRRNAKRLHIVAMNTNHLLALAETLEKRQQKLEHFFRESYAKAFNLVQFLDAYAEDEHVHSHQNQPPTQKEHVSSAVLTTSLTKAEFAQALGMKENDAFVQRMFSCVARKKPDKICFDEFLQTVRHFSSGTLAQRLQIVFKMCDTDDTGVVDRAEFCSFVSSIVNALGSELTEVQYEELVNSMIRSCGISDEKQNLTYKDFEALLNHLNSENKPLSLQFKGAHSRLIRQFSDRASVQSFSVSADQPSQTYLSSKFGVLCSFLEDYRQHIACLTVFFAVTIALFFERFWHYVEMTEHRDMRRVMGAGIAITRGAAGAMSFSYSILPLTVCKNVITLLRETFVNDYVPFDAAVTFHKIVAIVSMFFAVIHTIGHCINFYHVSTQSPEGLGCLFREAVFSSDFQPSFTYWLYGTVTGITGVLLVLVLSIIYVFATPSIINNAYYAFRLTHLLSIIFYVLMIVHGLPRLLDAPRFWCFLIVPAIVFVFDRILNQRRRYRRLDVIAVEFLPSDVIYIQFKRPRHFHFRSGQWIKINCPAFNCNFNEWHAFSIASSPKHATLEIYVKLEPVCLQAQGPWTWKLREVMQDAEQLNIPYPVLHMDGPYGGGNQDWYNYEVVVMVGGGIGVTPYASILPDLVQQTSSGRFSDVLCRKVYFLWICPTHRNFDWFIDVLRHVEERDVHNITAVHIFVTQFFHRYDLRTTMLYICEKHFQRIANRSMFTGLKATNHFGRPNMPNVLKHIQEKHSDVRRIGVFSCGPGNLNRGVREACEAANRGRNLPHFIHKHETF